MATETATTQANEAPQDACVEGLGDPRDFDREIRGRMTVVVRRNVTAAPAGS